MTFLMAVLARHMCFATVYAAWKDAAQPLYYSVAIAAALVALWTYRENSRRERAKWMIQLYEKFYEEERYKPIREMLDCELDSSQLPRVKELVDEEDASFTDYLNFFEFVAFLAETKQIEKSDVLQLFQYYLKRMKQQHTVMAYIDNDQKGFEQLRGLLKNVKIK
jgi:hypothetical protein